MSNPAKGRSPARTISTAITRLTRDHYGRGATRTKTIINGDYVLVFLEDIYTPVEKTLIEAGRPEVVSETRQVFQQAMRRMFSDAVEQVMGRKVVAFMSQVHMDPDMSAEIFVLEPEGTPSDDLAD